MRRGPYILGTYLSTVGGRLIQASSSFLGLLGYTSLEELRNIPLEALYENPQEREALLAELRAHGQVQARPVRLRHRGGHTIELWISALLDSERELIAGSLFDPGPLERRYQELVDSVQGIVWEVELPSWRFTYVSPYAETLLGYPVEQWLEEPDFWAAHIHPEDRERAVAFCKRMTEAGQDHEFTYRMLSADGRLLYIHDRVTVLQEGGRAVRLRGIMTDQTAFYELKAALEESEARFRTLVEHLPDALAVHQDGRLVYVNPEGVRLMRVSGPEVLLGRSVLELVHPDYHAVVLERIRHALTTGEAVPPLEEVLIRPDGSTFYAEVRTAPINWEGKAALLSIVRDVTERERIERELTERRELLEMILREAPDPISIGLVSADRRRLVYVNPAFERMTGYTAAELLRPDFNIFALVDPAYVPLLQERFRRVELGLPVPDRYELRLRSRDGRGYDVEVSVRPILWEGEEARLNIFRDITARKTYEEELKRAQREAEEAARMKTHFLASMSHEIRTPLTGILGFAELLRDELVARNEAQLAEFTQSILASGHRLLRLLSNLLDLAALEANRMPLEPRTVRLETLLEELVHLHKPEAERKGLALLWQRPAHPVLVRADEVRLRQAIDNFLRNAVQYTDHGQIRLSVSVAQDRREAHVEIVDTGRGMSAEFLERALFEPFRQESEGFARAYEGGGLEMAIARRLLERMEGWVQVSSSPGAGTAVRIGLPLPPQSPKGPFPEGAYAERLRLLQPRVLIIEDIPEAAELLRAYLRGLARVSIAPNAELALEMAVRAAEAGDPFGVFLVDLHLPGGRSGVELARALRADPAYARRPIIAQTAYASGKADEEHLLLQGFDAVLSKPIRRAQLLEVLDRILRATESHASSP
ncbi:MAG: PAS domain S-box protein [Bacteroidota bacterium]|nr:PAS domain S-box protein [Rhodothermia bacterium]MDW8138122.1 PAS domain S-box protein [Bacteroidota bacterium]MDW8285806.1 PAS domain S-box protein [Bacteroidota bacterium]